MPAVFAKGVVARAMFWFRRVQRRRGLRGVGVGWVEVSRCIFSKALSRMVVVSVARMSERGFFGRRLDACQLLSLTKALLRRQPRTSECDKHRRFRQGNVEHLSIHSVDGK